MGNDTKVKLLLQGIEVLQSRGFHGMGLAEVLSEVEVPKGSFYHYFKSKEDFVAECLALYWTMAKEQILTIVNDTSLPPIEKLKQIFCVDRFEQMDGASRKGCLLGKLASETPAIGGVVIEQINRGMSEWAELLEQIVKEGQGNGSIQAKLSAKTLTSFLMDAWEGALIHMRLSNSVEALRSFHHIVFEYLLTHKSTQF